MAEGRKLAAILIADIAGYSRLIGKDEDRTVTAVRALQADVAGPAIRARNGRLVKRTGDGFLAEFRSVVEAVRCALDIQTALAERNAGTPDDRRIALRIGIHLGDVIEEADGDLMGDGVNVAARLESLAAPGALSVGSDDAKAVVLGGFALVMLRQDYPAGMDALHRAVALNPGSGFVNAMAGSGLVFGGDADTGIAHLDRAMSLRPKDPNTFLFLSVAAVGHLFRGDAETAARLGERSLALYDGWDSAYWVLVSAYTALGRLDEARATAARLLAAFPEARVSAYQRTLPMRSEEARAMVMQSLRSAGVPERPTWTALRI